MSKSKGKSQKVGPHPLAVSAIATLRPRLDRLFDNPALPQQDASTVVGELESIVKGVKPEQFLPPLLSAFQAAPAAAQAKLSQVLPDWLSEQDYLATLETLLSRHALPDTLQPSALVWLQATGREAQALVPVTQQNMFYQAARFGNEFQASLILLWYVNPGRTRVQGMNFLIDYNPPWDGAVKDIIFHPQKSPQEAEDKFIGAWRQRSGGETTFPDAVAAKTEILEALLANEKSNIRLPRDLAAEREAFVRYVLTLPDGPDTPEFTAEDFDALRNRGQRPEDIMITEQTLGYRTRMPDGKEILMFRDPDD